MQEVNCFYPMPKHFFVHRDLNPNLNEKMGVPLQSGMCLVVRHGMEGGAGWVSWKFWVGGCATPPPPPIPRRGGTFLGFWVGFPFSPLSATVSISRHNMKKVCECGLYVADLEKSQQEHLKSAEHKSRVAASKRAGVLGGFIKRRPAFPTLKQIAEAELANPATDCTNSAISSFASASTSLGAPAAVQGGTPAALAAKQGAAQAAAEGLHNQQQLLCNLHQNGRHARMLLE